LGPLWHFQRQPIPGLADVLASPPPAARDVQFAKGMTLHHQAALDMAREYGADPAARNGLLQWLNVGIVTDQTQEIALMQAVVRRFAGDADTVPVDMAMVHGMPGQAAPAIGAGHAGHADAVAPVAAPTATVAPRRRRQPAAPARHDHH
jgi:uncharacterized protein (DUF305 family)